jgi:uncharacterized protein YjbI with pentapeptide repeats
VATAAELKRRWDGLDAARLVREVRTWLFGQGPRPDGLGEVDGRVDLRGIPLTATPGTVGNPDDPAAGVVWEGLDLSGAQVEELRFFGGRVTGCRFDGASLTGLKMWGTSVEDSSFRRADLRSRALGTGEWKGLRNVWRRVAFDRANLRESVFLGCVLEECTFEKTTKLLQITDSEVRGCIFTGQLTSLLVSGQGHQFPVSPRAFSADFSAAVFRDSKIEGYSLDQVRLPEQEDLLVVRHYPGVMKVAASYLDVADPSPAGRSAAGILKTWFKAPGSEDSDVCFDLGGFGDPAIGDAVRQAVAYAQDGQRV